MTRKLTKELEVGVDAYFKRARNLIDDGQFGQALVLTAFNYDRAYNTGVEFKSVYQSGDFRAYGNLAWGRQRATQVISNQFLFSADDFPYIATHYIYTDHAQTWTGSAGASYRWLGTLVSADLIYGSGLRSGFANTDHVSPYTQVNLGLSREFSRRHGASRSRSASMSSTFSTTHMNCAAAPASACSPRNMARAGVIRGAEAGVLTLAWTTRGSARTEARDRRKKRPRAFRRGG